MAKEVKTSAELQAIFRAELDKLGIPETDKLTIQPVSNNARLTSTVFQAVTGRDTRSSAESAQDRIGRALQDRYDLSDES
jgi:hypothetical protein